MVRLLLVVAVGMLLSCPLGAADTVAEVPAASTPTPQTQPATAAAVQCINSDWPQWRGPQRDSISPETGLSSDWSVSPPRELWRGQVGLGYSAFAVVKDKAYTLGWDWRTRKDIVWCLDADTGQVIWKHAYPSGAGAYVIMNQGSNPEYMGSRASPAVDEGRVYTLSADGQAFCLEAAAGKVIWYQNLARDLQAKRPLYGFSGSPLVKGRLVLFAVGMYGVALDKITGQVVWNTGDGVCGQASPVLFARDQQDCVLLPGRNSTIAASLADGRKFWECPPCGNTDPVLIGDMVVLGGRYGAKSQAISIGEGKPAWMADSISSPIGIWPTIGTPVYYRGFLYSASDFSPHKGVESFVCADLKDGSRKWDSREKDLKGIKAAVLADGKLYVQALKDIYLFAASPDACRVLGQYTLLGNETYGAFWTPPAISGGRLFCRSDHGEVVVLDIRPAVTGRTYPPVSHPVILEPGPEQAEREANRCVTPPAFQPPTPADWSQWRGPHRDGVCPDKKLHLDWSAAPPKELWRKDVGFGYSAVVAAGDRIYTAGWRYRSNAGGRDSIWCLEAKTGRKIWDYSISSRESGVTPVSGQPNSTTIDTPMYMGSRATPLLDQDRLYAFNQAGQVFCLNAADGRLIWTKHLEKDFVNDPVVARPVYYYGGSPLILGQKLILAAGKSGLALNKDTGEIMWTTGAEACGQASPVAFQNGDRQGVILRGTDRIYAVDAANGQALWNFPCARAAFPVSGDPVVMNGNILLSAAEPEPCALLSGGSGQPIWKSKVLDPKAGTPILHDGYAYGPNQTTGEFVCVDAKDGKEKWRTRLKATQVILAEDKLVIQCQDGKVVVAAALPDGFRSAGEFQAITSAECWTLPVISGKRLYIRSWEGELAAFDLNQ